MSVRRVPVEPATFVEQPGDEDAWDELWEVLDS